MPVLPLQFVTEFGIMLEFIKLGHPIQPFSGEVIQLVTVVGEQRIELAVLVEPHSHEVLCSRYIE